MVELSMSPGLGERRPSQEDTESLNKAVTNTQDNISSADCDDCFTSQSTTSATSPERSSKRSENVSTPSTEDARDEEEESFDANRSVDDPYTYSDDSASLSDAYFLPQSSDEEHLARPPRYVRNEEQAALLMQHQYPMAHYYGSINQNERAASPFWGAGAAIQEDSEVIMSNTEVMSFPSATEATWFPAHNAVENATAKARRERKRQRRQKRYQLKSANRERAVTAVRGKPQDTSVSKDWIWAVLFLAQLLAVFFCAIRFGYMLLASKPSGNFWNIPWQHSVENAAAAAATHYNVTTHQVEYTDDDALIPNESKTLAPLIASTSTIASPSLPEDFSFTIDYKNVIALLTITGFYSCVVTYMSFGFMLVLARALIHIMLLFSVALAIAWGVIGLSLDPYGVISLMGFTALLLTLGYTVYNWNRIPLAATNLNTALCAMRCTADITILGLLCLAATFAWCFVWGMAFIGIVNSINHVECDQKDECSPHVAKNHVPLYVLLLLSFHWTNTVIKNITRVTVASVIGTWWFSPGEIGSFFTSVLLRPLSRSLTKSLGSICLGSLVVQPAQILIALNKCCCPFGNSDSRCTNIPEARSDAEGKFNGTADQAVDPTPTDPVGLVRLIKGCCVKFCIYLRSCNRWSYTYIGMYGYGFAEAGEKAIQLFETREWMDVVKDGLIQNVLLMASLIVGGSTGTFAVVIEEVDGFEFTSFHQPIVSAFLIGSVLGYVLSNVLLLGVVGSAVNTVLVCFAAGPFEFDRNHPRLSREMREAWSQQVWEPAPI